MKISPARFVDLHKQKFSQGGMVFHAALLYAISIKTERWEIPMKKLTALFLTIVLSLSLLTAGASAAKKPQEPEPTPTPEITLQPLDPNRPGEPGIEPQDDLPNPGVNIWDED